jgi:transposase
VAEGRWRAGAQQASQTRGRVAFPGESLDRELAWLRTRVAELEAAERKLSTERDILRAAAKYFAGETRW